MSRVAVVRPGGNGAAGTLHSWGQKVVNDVGSSSPTHTLNADLDTQVAAHRLAVEGEMQSCRAVFFFGEGDWACLYNGTTPVVDTGNVARAFGHLLVAIACKSAHMLGNDAINRHRVEGYLGFDEDLGWTTGHRRDLWGMAFTIGISDMLSKGATLDEAANAMRDELERVVHYFKFGIGRTDPNAQLAYLWASWDRGHLMVVGNRAATL